jgi:hypothetical protein
LLGRKMKAESEYGRKQSSTAGKMPGDRS